MVWTPPITTLSVVPDENPNILSQSWLKPFATLLFLLRISRGDDSEYVGDHKFCFQHTHDLSELSRIFLSLDDLDSSYGQAFLAELEEYANRVLSRVHDWSSRLIEKDIIQDTSPFQEVDLLTCPLCHSHLRSCQECDAAVACSNHDCASSQVVDCKQCDDHDHMTCHECLASAEADLIPSFVRCPKCNSWR
ncbi:hypothetical protein OG21DRAFT_148340 [Imleria badia]|nr:hypothetical protein OG21DRAFT_148340 [Imleria badia]